jgi:acyl-CoA reductase-like NAD-dependent aldehyde dehydrogenase
MLRVLNPATEEVLAELAEDGPSSIARKLERAGAAQRAWAARPLAERLAALARFRDAVAADREALARTLSLEVGKPIAQARVEVGRVGERIDFFLHGVEAVLRDEVVHQDAAFEERITQEPLGVVANISAWNYPWFVGANVFVPALLVGNAVLYKPSEHATLTGLAIARLLHASGVPEDVFVPILGAGAVGAALLEQPVAGVFFTGSYAVGRRIAEAVAPRMLRLQLELGGKDPAYVAEDVDIDAAAAAVADGAFYNNGQSCCAVERIYVHRAIAAPFVEAFTAAVRSFVVGDPLDESTYIGPLTRGAHLAFLEEQLADALGRGGRLLCGGRRLERPGFYFEPAVLDRVDHSMALMREETFGPLVGIETVEGDEEAVLRMGDTSYGLTAAVYSADGERARRVLEQLDVGSAYWNCCDRVSPRLPWSGRRHSGVGCTLSVYGIHSFLQPRAWHLRRA